MLAHGGEVGSSTVQLTSRDPDPPWWRDPSRSLAAACPERPEVLRVRSVAAHDHQPVTRLKWKEQLAAQGVPLHELDGNRHWPRFGGAQAYGGFPALISGVESRQVVKTFVESLVDRLRFDACALDHVAEGSEDNFS